MLDKQKPSAGYGSWVAYIKYEIMTWPNAVTSIRLGCAVWLGLYFIGWTRANDIGIFLLALVGTVSDAIDGWLAKKFGWGTKFGQRYDQYVDWFFGIALLYALYLKELKEKLFWNDWPYNGELLVLIGMYLLLRTFIPLVDTTRIAKWKTGMQFTGAVIILGGHAWSFETIINIGYMLVWSSIGVMMFTLVDYMKTARSH